MGTISSSIQMMDRLTSPVLKMANAMASLVTTMEAADNKKIDPKGLDSMKDNIARANAELQNLQTELAGAGAQTQQNNAKQQQWNSSIHGGGKAMNGLINKLKTAVGLYALVNGAKKLAGLSDEVMTIDARLNLITNTSAQKNNLKNAAYQMAQEARVPLNSFTNDVAKLGILAGKRFTNNAEIIQFMGNATKAFKVAGTSASETAGAMTQLNQALASGVLQGDEFRSIRENAPLITQAIANEMGASQDQLKKLASEGKITADVVRRAVLGMTNDINSDFSKLPMTWGELWIKAGNFAIRTLEPLLLMINRVANSEKFYVLASGIANAFEIVAGIIMSVFETALNVGSWMYDNWNMVSPIIYAVIGALIAYNIIQAITTAAIWAHNIAVTAKAALDMAAGGASFFATAAQYGLNAAIYAFPGTWIVMAIVGVIVGLISLIVVMGKTVFGARTATGAIAGAFAWLNATIMNLIAWIINTFIALVNGGIKMANGIIDCINGMIRGASQGLSNFANMFIDAFNWIMRKADEFINGLLQKMQALGPLFAVVGISLPSGTGGALQLDRVNFSASQIGHIGLINGGNSNVIKYRNPNTDAKSAAQKWDQKQDNFMNSFKNIKNDIMNNLGDLGGLAGGSGTGLDPAGAGKGGGGNVGKNTGDTAKNTGKMVDSLEDTEEEMKYLRELAEQEHINQFTTAEIKVEMNNNNTIENETDIDKVIRKLTEKIEEKMNRIAEGVYE